MRRFLWRNESEPEILDLYDKDRQKTTHKIRRGSFVPEGLYRLVVHVVLFRSDGKMLIQQRQKDKKGWSDLWDLTIGGHVKSGETSSGGAQRELFEELGIEMDFSDMRPAFSLSFASGFDDYYIVEKEIDLSELTLQPEEVQAVRWADKEEILNMIDSGKFIKYKTSLIELIFAMKNLPGAHQNHPV